MTERERFMAAITGAPVDRPPIWLREGFEFHDPAGADDFARGWQADPVYRAFCEEVRVHCALRVPWSPGGHFNRTLAIPPHRITSEVEHVDADTRRHIQTIDTPQGPLTAVRETHRGEATSWTVKYPVETVDDLSALRAVPFDVAPVSYSRYERAVELAGDQGIPCLGLSSPWVVFSTVMPYEKALEWSLTERAMVHEVLGEITDRMVQCLETVCSRSLDTMANIGGCEQCTPPMMGPEAFAEFVTPYDGRLVEVLNRHGIPVNCHCHGRVSRALPEMVRMGCDSTDPVEPPVGGGDVTIAEARALVGDRLTLCGNLQFDELCRARPRQIRDRVEEILATGPERLVVSASAGPISRPTGRLLQNYRALIDTVLEAASAG